MTTVSELMQQAAKRQHKDLAAVARATGLPRSYVSAVANGKKRVSVAAAVSLGRELGIEPRRLLIAQLDAELAAVSEPVE